MPVARAIWFLVTLPLRAVFWLMWQLERRTFAALGALQRWIGQRAVLLLIAGVIAAFGIGLAAGWIGCGPRLRGLCSGGWEVPVGIAFAGFGGYLAYVAVRTVPNVKQSAVMPERLWWVYDPRDWTLSWRSVAFVGSLLAITLLVVWLVISLR